MNNLPTMDIKGKPYVQVKDRILAFHELYPNGSFDTIKTETDTKVDFKAIVTPDVSNPTRIFTGHSQATWGDGYINKTAATENAETSAVGRALGFLGIGIIDSVASADEMNKAMSSQTQNLPPRSDLKQKPVQLTEQEQIDEFNRPLSVDEMAAMMDGEVIQRKGPLPEGFRKFPDCPHENIKGSAYRKCYSCNLKREVS